MSCVPLPLSLRRSRCCRNVEAALGGKSDPYVRVQVRNVTKGRTEVINNSRSIVSFYRSGANSSFTDLNPVWDQIIYIPGKSFSRERKRFADHPIRAVHSAREVDQIAGMKS